MAADVRRWGGYCRRTSSIAALTLGGVGGHAGHIGLLATGHRGHLQAGGHRRHVARACLGLGMPALCVSQKVPDTGGTAPPPLPPVLSPGGASAPPGPSPACAACAGGFALRAVTSSRSRFFTLVARRSCSLVMSANRNSASRLSSLALDRQALRSRLAAYALIARASHAPGRCICCCCSNHSCTAPLCPRPAAGSARSARSTGVAVREAFGGGGGGCPLRGGALSASGPRGWGGRPAPRRP